MVDSPEDLVQRQLNAYNFGNIEAFLEPYHEDVEVYNFPELLQYKGKETMRRIYSEMFNNTTNLSAEITERIVQGNVVIDKENVQIGNRRMETIAIYQIENNKIKKVTFLE